MYKRKTIKDLRPLEWWVGGKGKERRNVCSKSYEREKQAGTVPHIWGEKEKRRKFWETILPGWGSADFPLSRFKDFHAVSGLPPRAPLNTSLVSYGDHRGWGWPQDHIGAAEFQQESTGSRTLGNPRWCGGCQNELPFPGNCISSPFNFAQHNSSVARHSLSPSMVQLKQR